MIDDKVHHELMLAADGAAFASRSNELRLRLLNQTESPGPLAAGPSRTNASFISWAWCFRLFATQREQLSKPLTNASLDSALFGRGMTAGVHVA